MSKNLKNISDEELYHILKSDKNNARLAFDEIYTRYSQLIYTFCRKYLNTRDITDDMFQEVFTKLYLAAKEDTEINNIGGYLYVTARNLCLNENQKKTNSSITYDNLDFNYNNNNMEYTELQKIIDIAINSLPDQFKEVIIMKEYLDMTYEEIAQVIGQNKNNARIRIFRAKEKLREILQPILNDYQQK